jgi:hypothetical protein
MATVNFNPLVNPQDPECAICRDTTEENEWVFHEEATSQQDQKVQHTFHKKCLMNWLKMPEDPRSCPLCRKTVNIASVLTVDEIANYMVEENRAGNEWVNTINKMSKRDANRAILTTVVIGIAENILLNASGINIKGACTTLLAIFVAHALAPSPSLHQADPATQAVFFYNTAFPTALISALDQLSPFYIPSYLKSSRIFDAPFIVPIICGIATYVLSHSYLPSKFIFVPGNLNAKPYFEHHISLWGPCAIIGSLFSRSIWKYFTGSV